MVEPFLTSLFRILRPQWILLPALALYPISLVSQVLHASDRHSLSIVDPYEPNDSAKAATLVSYGFKSSGAEINPATDVDYYKFVAAANDFVGIEVMTEESSGLDVKVLLYDSDGNELVEGDRVDTGSERILYGIEKTGVYYVRIAHTENALRFPLSIEKKKGRERLGESLKRTKTDRNTGPYVFSLTRGNPVQPFSLSAGSGFNGMVPLRWAAPLVSGNIDYKVYRGTTQTGPFTQIGTAYREDFVDITASNDVSYFYRVTAIYGATGVESDPSNLARGIPSAAGFKVSSPYSATKVNLDGTIEPSEWADAGVLGITSKRLVNPPAMVRLYVKNDEKFLHVAVDDSNGTESTYNVLAIGLDRDNNNTWDKNIPSDEGIILVERDAFGKPLVTFYGIHGDYPDQEGDSEIINPPGIRANFSYASGHIQYELSIDITRIAVVTSLARSIGIYITSVSDVTTNGEAPFGGLLFAPMTYADLSFAVPPAPIAPTLVTPTSGAINQPVIPTISWNQVAGATNYRLQVSTDNTFTSFVEHDSILTETSKQVGPLDNNTQYYWRVSARNFGGESAFSDAWSFRTIPLAPAAPNLLFPAQNAGNRQDTLLLIWSGSPGATSYHLQVALTGTFVDASIVVDDLALTDTLKRIGPLAYNTTYYWRVSAKNDGGTSPFTAARSFTTASTATITPAPVSFPAQPTASTSYRMISFPGTGTVRVGDFVSGNNKTDWRVYRDMGDPTGLVEITSTATTINIGEGVWLLRKGDLSLSQRAIPMPALSIDGTYSIPLRQAWTIIGNPFDKTVQWSSVLNANGLPATLPLYTYDGTFRTSTALEPFKGYYFDNRNAQRSTLKIPYPSASLKLASPQSTSVDWKLQLIVESDLNQDVENFIGIAPSARSGLDELDTYKPPLFLDQTFLYFVHPNWNGSQAFFNGDFRQSVGEGQIWNIEVANPRKSLSKIRFLGLETVPAEYDVMLVNFSQTRPVNLRIRNKYEFLPSDEKTRFELIVGKREFIEQAVEKFQPRSFELLQNYPNPFNPTTSVEFAVSRQTDGRQASLQFVSIKVFDMLGREVAVLVNEERAPGIYTLTWDASSLPSGVYLYRMRAGNFVETRKMILAK